MQQIIEQQIRLPRVSVLLANIEWDAVQAFHPTVPGYYVTQRLSPNHSPLRFESPAIADAFARVGAVGLLPPTFSVQVSAPETAFRGLSCVFDEDYFESVTGVTQACWQAPSADYLALSGERVDSLMQLVHREVVQPGFGSEIVIESASNMLLVELARQLRGAGSEAPLSPTRVKGGLASWQLRRIHERVAAGPAAGYPSLAELAALCAISEGHLMRGFRASTGASLGQYIARQRMHYARSLLREDALSLGAVARQLGFSSSAYFATAFRRVCGVTPSQYRRRMRATGSGS